MLSDTTREIEEMQNDLWMKRSPRERAKCMFGMFVVARKILIQTLPKDLSEREIKEQIYFRTYGEHLPEDFFKD